MTSSWVTVAPVAPFYEGDLELIRVSDTARLLQERMIYDTLHNPGSAGWWGCGCAGPMKPP